MRAQTSTIVLSVDPGYDRVGWGVGEVFSAQQIELKGYGCIQTDSQKGLVERYQHIDRDLTQIMAHFQPTELAIESLFFSKNEKTALLVSEARGVILSCAFRQGLTIYEYNPVQMKQTVTGYGKADKTAIKKMVELQLKLKADHKQLDDTLDALGLLITHAASALLRKRV